VTPDPVERDHAGKHAVLVEYLGHDRGCDAVAADGQGYIHWVLTPGQAHFIRGREERLSQGADRRDQRLQPHAIDDPHEDEQPTDPLDGAGRDRDGGVPVWSVTASVRGLIPRRSGGCS
jgi:hypothetical protein